MQSWSDLITHESQQAYYLKLQQALDSRRQQGAVIYPPQTQVYSAFDLTPLDKVKVVILGQDPYHGAGQAHGLAFSVNPGVKIPPSLRNMYKELATDISGFVVPESGDLRSWAKQGVLLLNTVLTVEDGQAHAHAKLGWETFTDAVIRCLDQQQQPIVFLLWGSHAQKKAAKINTDKHIVLSAAHPSPLSAHRGFFGCQHFSACNRALAELGFDEINWQIPQSQLSLV